MGNYYNIEELKSVNIFDILRDYGIAVDKNGFFAIRNERTPSCKIYAKTNSFYDFGAASGGNVINLVEKLEKCTRVEAMEKLAFMYGIEPVNKAGMGPEKIRLTDSQYAMIGIAGDKATKNMTFDLELDIDELKKISDKYMMPMNELKEKYLPMYETIISTVAIDEINRRRKNYIEDMHYDYVFRNLMKTIEQLPIPSVPPAEEITRKFGDETKKLNRMEKVMKTACQGCKSIKFKPINHDAITEYHKMTTEMGLTDLCQALLDNPIWFSAFDKDRRDEILAIPKEYNDYVYMSACAAQKIVEVIEKDAQNTPDMGREMEHTYEK